MFQEKIEVSITQYLQNERDSSIKKILTICDVIDIPKDQKAKLRKVILDEINDLYLDACRVLTYIQEKDNNVD